MNYWSLKELKVVQNKCKCIIQNKNLPLPDQLIGEMDCCREFEAVENGGKGLSGGVPISPLAVTLRILRRRDGLSSSL